MSERLFKILDEQGRSYHGGDAVWNLPTRNTDGTWTPGEWMPEVEGELVFCENGYHLAREQDLPMWLGPAIYEAEVFGEVLKKSGENKVVARSVRLTRRLNWNEKTARLFACWCVRQVWHLLDDDRSRKAVEVAERFANGGATLDELAAARDAAKDAAWEADRDAAWGSAREDAREAAWEAAKDAAWDAAWAAAWDAAWAAAGDAAQAAANRKAAWAAAGRKAALTAQAAHLIEILQEQS